jgi:beta-galactosidase
MMEYGWNRRFGYRGEWNGETQRAILSVRDYMTRFAQTNEWAGFVSWTFSESMGESHDSDGVCSKFGAVDANGRIPKLEYEALKTIWRDEPAVFLLGHWNQPTGTVLTVHAVCHPAIRRAELRLNGDVCGMAMDVPPDRVCEWSGICWQSGELAITGWVGAGTNTVQHRLVTVGPPARIRLDADPMELAANGSDAVVVTATVVDADGKWCPLATNLLTFGVDGPGQYMGGFNHRIPGTHGSPKLLAEGGKMAVAVRSRTGEPGAFRITASAQGLQPGQITVVSSPVR